MTRPLLPPPPPLSLLRSLPSSRSLPLLLRSSKFLLAINWWATAASAASMAVDTSTTISPAEPEGPVLPTFQWLSGGSEPSISDTQRRTAGAGQGFEGGRVVRANGAIYLFTAEFKGWPVNANMRIAIWRGTSSDGSANVSLADDNNQRQQRQYAWKRVSTLAESVGNSSSIAAWNATCSRDNLQASPWAPFPVFDEVEDVWHVHWVSYACDLSWTVRVGIGNVMGAVSMVRGRGGIEGPYQLYSGACTLPLALSSAAGESLRNIQASILLTGQLCRWRCCHWAERYCS